MSDSQELPPPMEPATQADNQDLSQEVSQPPPAKIAASPAPSVPSTPSKEPAAKRRKVPLQPASEEIMLDMMSKDKNADKIRKHIVGTADIHMTKLDWVKKIGDYGQERLLDNTRLKNIMNRVILDPPLFCVHVMVVQVSGMNFLSPISVHHFFVFSLQRTISS